MAVYLSPGVYVEEKPSAVQPIAGVGTSTAGFIGVFPDTIVVPVTSVSDEQVGKGDEEDTRVFPLKGYPVLEQAGFYEARVAGQLAAATLDNDDAAGVSEVELTEAPEVGALVSVSYKTIDNFAASEQNVVVNETIGKGDGTQKKFKLGQYPVKTTDGFAFKVDGQDAGAALSNDHTRAVSYATFTTAPAANKSITGSYVTITPPKLAPAGTVKLCTSFADFTKSFGGFSTDAGQRALAHAVYGFFNNGGTRCFVVRETNLTDIRSSALPKFAAIDEIAIVAVPGITDDGVRADIVAHCKVATGDRFAIFDCPEEVGSDGDLDLQQLAPDSTTSVLPQNSDYAAFYFPWIQVFDPATKIMNPKGDGRIFVPPSGHIAGVYARVDTERGVHKAPANEPILGALDLKYHISKAQQDGLNPQGVNCIRDLNGNIRVWGARTIGGDANGEWKYINVRRLFLFLRESIDQGTQWVVFEPNDMALWAKIRRNIVAFLTNVWRAGALFGATPQEAFYVKCDAETNPPEVRDAGMVVAEIGVAVVKPAEFVIFRISQWGGPGK